MRKMREFARILLLSGLFSKKVSQVLKGAFSAATNRKIRRKSRHFLHLFPNTDLPKIVFSAIMPTLLV